MNFISFSITNDTISLVTDSSVARLVISYGSSLENEYEDIDLDTNITISNTALNLETLNNIYFKVEVFDMDDNSKSIGLYTIDIINEKEKELYNANNLKNTLDNLNYYEGVIESLTVNEHFFDANDFFYNYIDYLTDKLYGKSFLEYINKDTCNDNN